MLMGIQKVIYHYPSMEYNNLTLTVTEMLTEVKTSMIHYQDSHTVNLMLIIFQESLTAME